MASSTQYEGMEYEVFLSFRGSDTRDSFTSCLYHDMIEKGIRVFRDDDELQVGQEIEDILQALNNSQIYIPIFSKDFASSAWCLREVARMVDCISKSDGKKEILPLFFDVKPDDVKLRTELYSTPLSKHEEKYGSQEVKRWGDALVEVASRKGWKREGKEYGELIKVIVRELLLKLKGKNRPLPDHLVETDDLERIEELLDVDCDDHVRFVIIHGTGGIGKSTLASIIFNRFRSKFCYGSFLEDVRSHRVLDMQKKLLSETLGSNSAQEIYDIKDGIDRITRGLGKKKILVVIDNVDEKKQLENLAGSCDWFGCGSRIIITLRDIRIIPSKDNHMRPSNYMDYSVKQMPFDLAVQLFSKHAFRSDTPPEDCFKFSKEVISSIGRLPLTLEVVGSLFASTAKSEWNETLEDLRQAPYTDIRQTLMISINKLDDIEKAIFQDIACFCIGEDRTYADYMWRSSGYSPRGAVDVLLLMSLIKIDEHNKFWMHDEVRDLGRYIVKRNNVEDAGKRSWVWIDESTLDTLRSNEEKPAVRALTVGIRHKVTPEELACLPKLRFLGGERINFVGNFKNLLPSLRWLSWRRGGPLDFSATNFHPLNLVVLDLSLSNITHDWVGWRQIEMMKNLKILDLTRCGELTKTPDLSELSKLEKLILAWCVKLSTIDSSISKLKFLSTLNIQGCSSLQELPDEIGSLECLSEITMPAGGKPFKISDMLGNLKSLTRFEIRFHYGVSLLPYSIGRLMNLTTLSLRGCKNVYELPDSIGELESLVELDLQLSGITVLPGSIGNLKRLKIIRVGHTKIRRITCALGRVKTLEVLDASFCPQLKDKIPWKSWSLSLTRLRILDMYGTGISTLPTSESGFSSLQKLKISLHDFCRLPKLPSSLKYLVVEAHIFPDFADLSNLVHLHHLEVYKNRLGFAFGSINDDIQSGEDKNIPQFPVLPDLCVSQPNFAFTSGNVVLWSWMDEDIPTFQEICPEEDENNPEFSVLPDLCGGQPNFAFTSEKDITWPRKDEDIPPSQDFWPGKDGIIPQLIALADIYSQAWISSENQASNSCVSVRLERLRVLKISSWKELKRTPDLSGLKRLQELHLSDLRNLQEIPSLGELESLKFLSIMKCDVIEQLPNLSKLKNLQCLKLYDCKWMRTVEGLKGLNSLKSVEIKKCMSLERLPDLPASTKLYTD